MKHKVLVIDTSILCVWLKVKDRENCGPDNNKWNYNRVCSVIEKEEKQGTTFVLPLATIIETGNHITQAKGDKFSTAKALHEIIVKSADETTPWAAFTEQHELWSPEKLKSLSEHWYKETVSSGLSLGDASIVDVANYYFKRDFDVEILTGDEGLRAYQPDIKKPVPRRRRV